MPPGGYLWPAENEVDVEVADTSEAGGQERACEVEEDGSILYEEGGESIVEGDALSVDLFAYKQETEAVVSVALK